MGTGVATVIIEPRLLVRQALESLMTNHSYRVVCGVGSTAEIGSQPAGHQPPKLAVLSAQSTDTAVSEAVAIRKRWPDSKIILLFEQASLPDFQKLLASQVDGCVPLSVSPETLIDTLDLIMTKDVRVMVVADAKRPALGLPGNEDSPATDGATGKLHSSGTQTGPGMALAARHGAIVGNGVAPAGARPANPQFAPAPQSLPKLSEREAQILDGLVKGHANKVIARTCDITEATVKVHMKSILRKIRVANRTQAAIWALEHGYPTEDVKGHPPEAGRNPNGASLM